MKLTLEQLAEIRERNENDDRKYIDNSWMVKIHKDRTALLSHIRAMEELHMNSRWNIDIDGEDLLICRGDHEKGCPCRYVKYEPEYKLEAAEATITALEAENNSKQAKIDLLMLEYCPDEMTPEQLETWGCAQQELE